MIKRLLNILKPKPIKDSYFGEMGSTYDKFDRCYYLDKDIELENIYTPVLLYLKCSKEQSNESQQLAYESIRANFSDIWNSLIYYLTEVQLFITHDQLKREYRLESIILPEDIGLTYSKGRNRPRKNPIPGEFSRSTISKNMTYSSRDE